MLLLILFPAEHVVNALNDLVIYPGKPGQIRVDNRPEFISKTFVNWCNKNGRASFSGKVTESKLILLKSSKTNPHECLPYSTKVYGAITGSYTGNPKPGLTVLILDPDGSESDLRTTTSATG